MKQNNQQKCVVAFSNGLDSRLVVKVMQERGFDLIVAYLKLPFSKDEEKSVRDFCKEQKAKLKIFDCTEGDLFKSFMKLVREPCHGRGNALNPCVDCKIFILKTLKKFADEKKIEFIVTGEVEGQRPMSQLKKQLDLVEGQTKLKGRLLRPLGDLDISGRQRKKQIALAKKFKISYPAPAGGCLLCEKQYCGKLKGVLNKRGLEFTDIRLLKVGRHFDGSKIILSKNHEEGKILMKEKGTKIVPVQAGPTALVRGGSVKKAKELMQKYSKHKIKEFEVIE
jgi:tRNA-uridine 2-sulfurtransferase